MCSGDFRFTKYVNLAKPNVNIIAKWVKDAEAKGLPNAAKVLAEFRAEIAKQEK